MITMAAANLAHAPPPVALPTVSLDAADVEAHLRLVEAVVAEAQDPSKREWGTSTSRHAER